MSRRAVTLPLVVLALFGCAEDPAAPSPTPAPPVTVRADCHPIPAVESPRWSPYDPDVGVAFGTRVTGLYVTHDAGRSWERLAYDWSAQYPDMASGFAPSAAVFLDADRWIVTGAITRGNMANHSVASRVIATTDGGRTFAPLFEGSDEPNEVAYPRDDALRPHGEPVEAVFRLDERHLAVLSRGLLLGSADGGATFHARDVFGPWSPSAPVAGLPHGEIVIWQELDGERGLALDTLGGAVFTGDGGRTFTTVAPGTFTDAAFDTLGRVLVFGKDEGLEAFEPLDPTDPSGGWRRAARADQGQGPLDRVLWTEPDGAFIAALRKLRDARGPLLVRYDPGAAGLVSRPVTVEAGDGIALGQVDHVSRAGERLRLVVRGELGTPSAERRLLCEVSADESPTPLPSPGVPADLRPGELAVYAHRLLASESWDRMAFDANGHVYVAGQRALWGGPGGEPPLFRGGIASPAEWRPNAPTAELPEVGGVAVGPDGLVALGLNFFVGRTARRVLFIDPTSGSVRRWQELRPFEDGAGGYSEGDLYGLRQMGGLLFAMTGLGTADLDAPAELGPDARFAGLPGLGVARADGTYHYLPSRRPGPEGHLIGRMSIYSGALPVGDCAPCATFPGLIQAFEVDAADVVYVLDRREGAVYARGFFDEGAPWRRLASGFHNPSDLALRELGGVRLVTVLDGDVFAFRPDPDHPVVRGLNMRAGPGERSAASPVPHPGGCAEDGPCITPPSYPGRPELAALDGVLLLDPTAGQYCLQGRGFGGSEGAVRFGEAEPFTVTYWDDDTVCVGGFVEGLDDGFVAIESERGTSNEIPYLAAARRVRFPTRGDRPLVTGDTIDIVADNLGVRGHEVLGGALVEVTSASLRVLIDATFAGQILFRKHPSTELWRKELSVMPSELVGAVAGPNELLGVSGHLGANVPWTLDGEPLPGSPVGDWAAGLGLGRHTLAASFAGREVSVEVARVPYDTHHHGPLHPDRVALPPHRQGGARLGGQAYTLVRSSGWQRPGGPTEQLVPGVPEVVAYASIPRAGQGPFIPGQAFERAGRFGLVDRDYDASEDMPRLVEAGDAIYSVARAMEVEIELDNQGVPTVTRVSEVFPVTAKVAIHRPDEATPGALVASPYATVTAPNGADRGRIAGVGRVGGRLWVAFAAAGETTFAGESEGGWAPLGALAGEHEVHPTADGAILLRVDAPELRRAVIAEGALQVGAPVDLSLGGVAAAVLLAWRVEADEVLLALRLADGSERVAALSAEGALEELGRLAPDLPGIGASYGPDGAPRGFGVADLVRLDGEVIVALASGEGEARPGLYLARLRDGALTAELASVEVDRLRCLGPYPREAGACGTPGLVETNTSGCSYFACPKLTRLWQPQVGGAVEEARLIVDDDGLELSYAVRFPEGWSRDLLDRGRIRTAVFVDAPTFE